MTRLLGGVARCLAVVLVAALGLVLSSCGAAKAAYKDSRSLGAIALYGKDGKPVTGGKVTDKPFVWKAVSLAKAPTAYAVTGRKATLAAMQPRQNVDPEQWEGDFLTLTTAYPDPNRPTVDANSDDHSLGEYLAEYPAEWNGYVQLRIYLGAPGRPTLITSYASADIKVDNGRWTLLGGVPNGALSTVDGGACVVD